MVQAERPRFATEGVGPSHASPDERFAIASIALMALLALAFVVNAWVGVMLVMPVSAVALLLAMIARARGDGAHRGLIRVAITLSALGLGCYVLIFAGVMLLVGSGM